MVDETRKRSFKLYSFAKNKLEILDSWELDIISIDCKHAENMPEADIDRIFDRILKNTKICGLEINGKTLIFEIFQLIIVF